MYADRRRWEKDKSGIRPLETSSSDDGKQTQNNQLVNKENRNKGEL
jgi:hypothetical protein